jgi:uncharacterized protein YbcI
MSQSHLSAVAPREARGQRGFQTLSSNDRGKIVAAISDGLVELLAEFYGRGPSTVKSYYQDDLVVCVLRGGLSRVERALLDAGRGQTVIEQRMEFRELILDRFIAVVENATSQRVIGSMSGHQQSPDMRCEVFILAPADLFVHEQPARSSPPLLSRVSRGADGRTVVASGDHAAS